MSLFLFSRARVAVVETAAYHKTARVELELDVDRSRVLARWHLHHPAVGVLRDVELDDFDLDLGLEALQDEVPRLARDEHLVALLLGMEDLLRRPARFPHGVREVVLQPELDGPYERPPLLIGRNSLHPSHPII